MNKPIRQKDRLERLLSRWGGSYVLRMQSITQLISYFAAAIGIYYILITANFSALQTVELLISVFGFVLFVNLVIPIYTAMATTHARTRLDILFKGKTLPAGKDENELEIQAWREIIILPWRFALIEIATAYLLVVLPGVLFMYRVGGATTIQIIHVAIGGFISSTWVVIQETLTLDRILAPIRRALLPRNSERQNAESGLRMTVRLQAIIASLILSTILMIGALGYQKLLNASAVGSNSATEIHQYLVQASIIGVVSIVFGLGQAGFLTLSVSQPVHEMIQTMDEIRKGIYSRRAIIITSDETAQLTIRLNQLLDELRGTQLELEHKVEERTSDLVRKSVQLQAASQVARDAAQLQDINTLLSQTVKLISERFGYYHCAIFLLNDTNEYAVLQAASSEGGQRMLIRGHRLKVGQQGIVGSTAYQNRPHIAGDVGRDTAFLENPDLPMTHSEAAVPLTAHGKVIGVLDIQSTEKEEFSQENIEIVQTLADQIGLAIQNARSLGESQNALQQLEATTNENIRRVWQQRVRGNKQAFRYTSIGLSPLRPSDIQPLAHDIESNHLNTPITLRGQHIGTIRLLRKAGDAWSDSDQTLAIEVANQVGLALENARLLQDAQRLASREQQISTISTRIQQSTDLDTLLQNTVRELGIALGTTNTFIQIGIDSQEDKDTN